MDIYKPKYTGSKAIIIGINDYTNSSPLQFAKNDAEAFSSLLVSNFGFIEEDIDLLLDQDATLENIRKSFSSLVNSTHPDDRVLIFFAGHGASMPSRSGNKGFLVPVDGLPNEIHTLLPWDELVDTSQLIPAKHMLFVLDACFSGLIGTRTLAPGSQRIVRDMLTRYSRQFISAGKADEVVSDGGGPRSRHSIFTGHLLNSLEGEEISQDGLIGANIFMAHLYDRVSKDPSSRQAPHHGFLDGDGDFYFTIPTVNDDLPDAETKTITIPADLANPDRPSEASLSLEKAKEYLSDPKHKIQLHDLVLGQLRVAHERLGDASFSMQSGEITDQIFADRLRNYETAMSDFLKLSVLMGRWSMSEHQETLRHASNQLGGQIELMGGSTLWLALRSYPMLLTMYATGIAAVDGGNYQAMRTMFESPAISHGRSNENATALIVTADAFLDVDRMNAFKLLTEYK